MAVAGQLKSPVPAWRTGQAAVVYGVSKEIAFWGEQAMVMLICQVAPHSRGVQTLCKSSSSLCRAAVLGDGLIRVTALPVAVLLCKQAIAKACWPGEHAVRGRPAGWQRI